jgi:putative endonuclease
MKSGKPNSQPWFVYLIRCANGALYTGIATDVKKRLATHNAGKGSAYVRANLPARLVAFTQAESRAAASVLEYRVKALTRTRKLALAREWKAQGASIRRAKAI